MRLKSHMLHLWLNKMKLLSIVLWQFMLGAKYLKFNAWKCYSGWKVSVNRFNMNFWTFYKNTYECNLSSVKFFNKASAYLITHHQSKASRFCWWTCKSCAFTKTPVDHQTTQISWVCTAGGCICDRQGQRAMVEPMRKFWSKHMVLCWHFPAICMPWVPTVGG